MVDSLKEYLDDHSASVPVAAALTVNIASPTATEQDVVQALDFTVTSTEQTLTATLEYKDNVLDTWTAARGDAIGPIAMAGSQLVDASASFDLKITPENYYKGFKIRCFSATVAQCVELSYIDSPLVPHGALTAAEIQANTTQGTTESTSVSASQAVACVYKGVSRVAVMDNTAPKIMELDGSLFETLDSHASTYCITADSNYLYAKSITNNTVLARWSLATGVKDTTITLDTAFQARPSNSGGAWEYYNGFIYSLRASDSTCYKINLSTGAVTSFSTVNTLGAYHIGSAVITTLEGTPRNLLMMAGSSRYQAIDLDTDAMAYDNTSNLLNSAAFFGNVGLQILTGVFWVHDASDDDDMIIDCNSGGFVQTHSSVSIHDALIHSNSSYAVIRESDAEHPDAVTYSAYAKGVHIDNS